MSVTASGQDILARETLRLIGTDPQNWAVDRDGLDRAANDAESGVLLTGTRTERLRTPKCLPGPELGRPHPSVQAWHEARYGADADPSSDLVITGTGDMAAPDRVPLLTGFVGDILLRQDRYAALVHRPHAARVRRGPLCPLDLAGHRPASRGVDR